VLYAVQQGPFIGMVQIIVYTGAIMILFLFVLMLVGRDSSDSLVETLRGQRVTAAVLGVLFAVLVIAGITQTTYGAAVGFSGTVDNVPGVAQLLFSTYFLAFEVTSALLITAAMGAMVLAHRERLTPKLTQGDLAAQRMRDYAERGKQLGPLPSPGVFARHNAVDTPALLPDGTPSEISVSRTLVARGNVRTAPADDVDRLSGTMGDGTAYAAVTGSGPRGAIDGEHAPRDGSEDPR
jgi:NADH-quinone oxidoreductase subunit J